MGLVAGPVEVQEVRFWELSCKPGRLRRFLALPGPGRGPIANAVCLHDPGDFG